MNRILIIDDDRLCALRIPRVKRRVLNNPVQNVIKGVLKRNHNGRYINKACKIADT